MRRAILLTTLATVVAVAPVTLIPDLARPLATLNAQAAASVSIDVFFPALRPYGQWVRNADYNYVWVPTQVDPDWSPYTHGHWVYTDRYGWYFQSDEPFAWAVYHYGRWGYEPAIGWYWVPGTRWAPAWVAWRRGDRHLGWAPLPPEERGYAVNLSVNINVGSIPQNRWTFVQSDRFLDPDLSHVVERGDRHFYQQARPVGAVTVQNNVIVNNVININLIQQDTHRKVDVHHVREVSDPKQARSGEENGSIAAFIANLAPPPADKKPEDAVDQQQAEKSKPPTRGRETANAGSDKGEGQVPANAENQQPPCVDTDPAKQGCQPAEHPQGNAEAAPAGQQGKDRRNAENRRPNDQQAPQAGGGNDKGEATAEQNPQACPNDLDPKQPGCQTNDNAGRAPSQAQGPAAKDRGQQRHQEGQAANANEDQQQACPQDIDPKKPGCQMPGQNAEQGKPRPEQQGAAAQPGGPKSGPAPAENQANNPGAKKQREASCPQDLDPRRPGCQQSPAPDKQGSLGNDHRGRNDQAQRRAPAQNDQQAADSGPNGKCKVDVDPRKPGCQQPAMQ